MRGSPASRASTLVGTDEPITVVEVVQGYVSRGGLKLDGALRDLDVDVAGRRWLDAGASTGGFTDRLLEGGAEQVLAVDVGYGQLAWRLREDERVTVLERTNIRHLSPEDVPWLADGVVADLSFISLTKVLPALDALATRSADMVLLVKPQFEVGKDRISKGGVVTDPELWRGALQEVAQAGGELGLATLGATVSDLKGPAGNTEFFLHLRRGNDSDVGSIASAIDLATTR